MIMSETTGYEELTSSFFESLQQAKAFLTDQRHILSVMVSQEGKIVMTWDNAEVSLSDVEKELELMGREKGSYTYRVDWVRDLIFITLK